MPPVIGLVATVIAGAVGIGATAALVIGVAASIGASLLLKPKPPKNSPENVNRLRANIEVRTPRKTVVGITAMATDIRDEEFTGTDQEYFHRFIVVASHKVQAIDEIWFDDKIAWSSGGGVQGEFAGYLTVATRLEGNSGNAINVSSRMGSGRRYTGCAYVHLRYKLTGNDKKAESPFARAVTTRITIRGRGAFFYDPRLDSTVAGGSGSHRADDQATWAWDDAACRNPALALLFYLLGWRVNGTLVVGKGIPQDRIDLPSFIAAANICDEPVDKQGGGTEPRYRCDGVWSEGDQPTTVIDMLKATMNADLDDVDGKLRLTIFTDDTATYDATFGDDDILGEFEWIPIPPLDQSFNIVRGTYTDPSDASLYQQVDYPDQSVVSPDGIDRIDPFDLPMVQSPSQAQRLAFLRLQRQLFGGVFRAEFQATAWKVQKNSIVRLNFTPTGFVNKLFRVAEMELRDDGVVPLVLREEDPDLYVLPSYAAAVAPIDAAPYDPFNDAIIQGIAEAITVASYIEGLQEIVIPADHAGTVSSDILPVTKAYKLFRDGVDVTTSAAWSVTVDNGTIGATIGAATGVLSLTTSGGVLTSAIVTVAASYLGTSRTKVVSVTRTDAPAPTSGGGGTGTSASTTLSGAMVNSTTFAAITTALTVTAGSAGTVDLTAPYFYQGVASGYVRTRWYQDIASVYTAIGSDTIADAPYTDAGEWGQYPGYGGNTHQVTGLTPGNSYSFKLYGRNESGSNPFVFYSAPNGVAAVGG